MRTLIPLVLLFALASPAALAQSVPQMQAQNDALTNAFAKGDAAAVRAMYGDNAVVLPDRGETVRGPDLLRFWQAVVRRIGNFKRVTLEVQPLGPGFALEIGHFSFQRWHDLAETSGKYVVVWQKRDGDWKRITDIWNTDR
jgi:ketosteroid isomerase-like protein